MWRLEIRRRRPGEVVSRGQCECFLQFVRNHRARAKDNFSSRCSIDKFVRAPFLIHSALNNDERATHSRFPLTNFMWRVRVRLKLMLAAAANATATPAPARHLWFTNGFSRRAFRYPAHAASVAACRTVFVPSSRSGWRMVLGAGSGGEKLVDC